MLPRIFVAGLINIETTLRIEGFPLGYSPQNFPFFGVDSTVSGVGYNIAKAMTILGHPVDFCALVGGDVAARSIYAELEALDIVTDAILPRLSRTPQSVILYDPDGRRAIHTDLKDIQEHIYPDEIALPRLRACDLAVICNINFGRGLLTQAEALGKTIATDVHALQDLDDPYNTDYMRHADILFMSHERLPLPPEDAVRALWARYPAPVIVIGLGAEGALLALRDEGTIERVAAVHTHPIVNSIGAGDALFSAFNHAYALTGDPHQAIRQAMVFASYKIGVSGAAQGFLTAHELDALCRQVYG